MRHRETLHTVHGMYRKSCPCKAGNYAGMQQMRVVKLCMTHKGSERIEMQSFECKVVDGKLGVENSIAV